MEFIKGLYEKAYDYHFRFPSFMSASKFYDSYAMKSRDGEEILEKYEDRHCDHCFVSSTRESGVSSTSSGSYDGGLSTRDTNCFK